MLVDGYGVNIKAIKKQNIQEKMCVVDVNILNGVSSHYKNYSKEYTTTKSICPYFLVYNKKNLKFMKGSNEVAHQISGEALLITLLEYKNEISGEDINDYCLYVQKEMFNQYPKEYVQFSNHTETFLNLVHCYPKCFTIFLEKISKGPYFDTEKHYFNNSYKDVLIRAAEKYINKQK